MLFDNAGGKIKTLAKIFFYVGIVVSVVLWIIILFEAASVGDIPLVFLSVLVLILGFLMSWISNILIYGFGCLIESNEGILENLNNEQEKYYPDNNQNAFDNQYTYTPPTSKVRFCTNCGNQLYEEALFCGKCGTKIDNNN